MVPFTGVYVSPARGGSSTKLVYWSTLTGHSLGQRYCCRCTRSLIRSTLSQLWSVSTVQVSVSRPLVARRWVSAYEWPEDDVRAWCHRCIKRPRGHGLCHCLSPHYRSGPKISDQDRPRPPKVTGLSPPEPQGLCQAWLRPNPSTIRHLPNPAASSQLILWEIRLSQSDRNRLASSLGTIIISFLNSSVLF